MTGSERLVEGAQIYALNSIRGTDDMGIGLTIQLRDSSGVPFAFHCYVPYEAPMAVDTGLEETCEGLLKAFLQHVDFDVWQDIEGTIDGGLTLVTKEGVVLVSLYGPCWQKLV